MSIILSVLKYEPLIDSILKSGTKPLYKFVTSPSNPLNMDSTNIIEAVENVIPITVIKEIIFIVLPFFKEKKYFFAIQKFISINY